MKEWLGEENAADALSQSVPNNITSEMGLELLDVADVIRPYPEVVEYLQHVKDDDFMDGAGQARWRAASQGRHPRLSRQIRNALRRRNRHHQAPLERKTKRRLFPMILNNIKNFEPGASHRKFEQGRRQALEKEHELLERLKQLPDGERKAEETKRKISLLRNFIGYREYPKYGIVSRYFVYKQALLKEAERLVQAGVIREKEDIYYLSL